MSSLNQFTSKSHDRSMRQSEPVAGRTRRHWFAATVATLIGVAVIALAPAVIARNRHDVAHWVGTWSSSPQAVVAPIHISGQTVRQIVHTSTGGGRVRVRLSNAYGTTSLVIGSAHVAISAGGDSIHPGTDRVLKFNGSPTITIPAGALAVSDIVSLDVPPLDDLAVSLYLAGERRRDDPACAEPANDLPVVAGRLHGREHGDAGHHHRVLLLLDRR